MSLKVLECFGGIGAFTESLKNKNIDFEVADYVEIDKFAVKSYNTMNDEEFEVQDICEWDKDIDVNFLIGGFPCQDVSLAGKQKGIIEGETRSGLMYEMMRIIEKTKPSFVLAENVKNILSKKHKPQFDEYINFLDEIGYNSYWQVLNTKNHGLPQNRERLFCLSIKKELDNGFEFPEKQELKLRLKDMLEDKVDEKYYLKDEKVKSLIEQLNPKEYDCIDTKMPKNSKSELSKTILASCYKEPLQVVEPTICEQRTDEGLRFFKDNICGTIRTINSGGDKRIIEPKIIKVGQIDSSFEHSSRVHSTEGISPTVMGNSHGKTSGGYNATKILEEPKINVIGNYMPSNHDASRIVSNEGIAPTVKENHGTVTATNTNDFRIRKLSPLECWRLQGFSDEQFRKAEKVCSSTQLYKQAGNSISVTVLEAILGKMIEYGYIEGGAE